MDRAAVGGGLLGMGMPRTLPDEMGMLMSEHDLRPAFTVGQVPPPQRDWMGAVPAGGFSPRDLLMMVNPVMRGPGLLGRGMAVLDPAERMFAPSLWSIVRGL